MELHSIMAPPMKTDALPPPPNTGSTDCAQEPPVLDGIGAIPAGIPLHIPVLIIVSWHY